MYICTLSLFAQESGNVTGTVSDDSGAVPGAAITVKGTNKGTATDSNGQFSLADVKNGDILVVSLLGYRTQEIQYAGQTNLAIILEEDTESLDEVVVTALGINKASRALGYAVSTIKANDLVKVGTPNFATALYGKAAGVRIQAAPGGNTSAVSITVRGLSSITGNTQPLLVMDGVPIRNGNANNGEDANKTSRGWDNDHIQGNGLIDINPEDIESISILKGAAATALYGSEAANGVILVTSKKGGGGSGFKVDFNATLSANIVAYMPKVQTEFGPGRETLSWSEEEMKTGGFFNRLYKGQTYTSIYNLGTAGYGPAYDGRDVLYWDGKTRPYESQTDAPWNSLFRTGYNQKYNVAVSYGGDKSNTRFSYTYVDDTPNQYNSNYAKHNFNVSGGLKITDNVSVDYSANYIRENIHNRPFKINWMFTSFNGIANSFTDMNYFRDHTVTSMGYRNVVYDNNNPTGNTLTPDEAFAFNVPYHEAVNNYIWPVMANNQYETKGRFISSVAPSWKIIDGLNLRGRLSTDLTSEAIESKSATVRPLLIDPNNPEGGFGVINKSYEIYYGDIMLMLDRNLTDDINLTANLGYQGRQEISRGSRISTNNGLATENWFHINASRQTVSSWMDHMDLLKTAVFGTLGLSWNNSVYLEGTVRQEKTSTLKKGNNSYVYPSVNASWIFSEQLKSSLPWYDYGKLRMSYGVVGNAPSAYAASVAYKQTSTAGFTYAQSVMDNYGNEYIKPETTYEYEIGLESRFLNNRIGFEVSYYNNRVVDQILNNTLPISTGASRILQNIGELKNYGVEVTLNATPVQTRDFSWDVRFNYAFNRNKVVKLSDGANYMDNGGIDGGGGQVELRSYVGRPAGDIYAFLPEIEPTTGKKILNGDGTYKMDQSTKKFVANVLPDAIGGFGTSFRYKRVLLDMLFDYRIGGYVTNWGYQYSMARGTNPESLKYRDEAHGGYAYYYKGNKPSIDNLVPVAHNATAPNGERIFHDGIKLEGVKIDGNGNVIDNAEQIVPVSRYNNYMYNWGSGCDYSQSIFDNSYLKLREINLSYRLPDAIISKFGCRNMDISIFARNLFYLFKNMPDFDAEATDGTDWMHQAAINGATATTRTIGISLRAGF
jgi:TonB-linked SusC/RagA family outer membrane protein